MLALAGSLQAAEWIQPAGLGLIAPASGSSSASVTCDGNNVSSVTFNNFISESGASPADLIIHPSGGTVSWVYVSGNPLTSYTWGQTPSGGESSWEGPPQTNTEYWYQLFDSNGHEIVQQTFTTPNCASDQSPVADAKISKDGTTYTDSIIVTQGVPTAIFLGANDSSDPDGWTHPTQGVSNGGKCEWNSDLNQGSPTFEQTINNPAAPSACNISLGTLTFNDAPGTYTYQVLKITDNQSAVSNIDAVQVTVSPLCPAGQAKPHSECSGGSCVAVDSCGVTSCASDSFCKPGDGLTQCADGIDNDGDGKVDHADSLLRGSSTPDPGCSSVSDDDETDVATCLSGETKPYSVCQSGSCVSIDVCGVSTCNNNQQCAPQPDYSLTNSGGISATVVGTSPAQSSNTTVRVTPLNGFNAAVNLSPQSVSPPISGIQHVFGDSTLNSGEYSNGSAYHVIVPGTTATGTYIVAVQGQGGGLTRSTSFNLNVNVTSPEFEEVFNPFFQLWTQSEIPILYLPASLLLGF